MAKQQRHPTYFAVLADPAFKTADIVGVFPTRNQARNHARHHPGTGKHYQPRAWPATLVDTLRRRGWDIGA